MFPPLEKYFPPGHTSRTSPEAVQANSYLTSSLNYSIHIFFCYRRSSTTTSSSGGGGGSVGGGREIAMEIIRESGSKQVGGGSAGGREISMEIIRETGGSTTQVQVLYWCFTQDQVPGSLLKSRYLVFFSSPSTWCFTQVQVMVHHSSAGTGALLKSRYWCFAQVQVPGVLLKSRYWCFIQVQVPILHSSPCK